MIFQISFACDFLYQGNGLYELNKWDELEPKLQKILKEIDFSKENLVFDLGSRASLAEISRSSEAVKPKSFSASLKSKDYLYWKSLVTDKNKVISVYTDNLNNRSEKIASFIIKRPEEDLYIENEYIRYLYQLERSSALREYKNENRWRGFRTLYEVPEDFVTAAAFQADNKPFIKSLLDLSKGERVLGLGVDNMKETFVTFEGYSSGVINQSGVEYLQIRVDGEDIKFSLVNILSLQTAVY